MEAPSPLGQSECKPPACSPWLSPSAKSLLGLHLVGAAFGCDCLGAVSPSWHGHYFSTKPVGLRILEVWNLSHTAVSCKMHSSVSMQRIKHCTNPRWESVHVIVIPVKNRGAFQFAHVAVSASEINPWFIWDLKNVNSDQIIVIKLSDNSSAVTVTKCRCAWALLSERLLRGGLLLPSISPGEHRASWLLVKSLRFTCHLWASHFGVAQGVSMYRTHFSVPLLTILLHPTPCRNSLRLNSPSHPCEALTWLKSLSWLTHQWICLISLLRSGGRVSADNGLYRAQLSVLTAASSPPGRESPIQPYKPTNQGRFIFICNFLTTQVFRCFCSACLDRGKATYSMR